MHTAMSVLRDLSFGSPGMNPVTEMMKSDPLFASGISKTLADVRDKPIVRCENCTKTPEEIDSGKFMVCSSCKSKLDFIIHYCSQFVNYCSVCLRYSLLTAFSRTCQKEDWANHKKYCGRRKNSKQLSGTAHDPYWQYPVPEDLRPHLPSSHNGYVSINSVGFTKPNSGVSYSPALEKQISLLTADTDAEYFLFDQTDRPVRVELDDTWTKMLFRTTRTGAWSGTSTKSSLNSIKIMAQYLISTMGTKPGLSRERILEQFEKEYGKDARRTAEEFEKEWTLREGTRGTFLERMGKNMASTAPQVLSGMMPKRSRG
jgi:hypothetical protein